MESMPDNYLVQFSSKYVVKEEQHQAVLGLREQKEIVVEGFNLSVVCGSGTQAKRK